MMSMYFEGYKEAREEIGNMNEDDLLGYIDDMYGRENLPEDHTVEDLRAEALNQCKRDFTDTSSNEYDLVMFYSKLHKAMKEN